MEKEEIKKTIEKAAVEIDGKKRLSCAKAFKLSEEHGIPLKVIGECCNETSIKIHACQLGCFQ